MVDPKLRTVTKIKLPYPLNKFPTQFPYEVGREIIYLLAVNERASLEGSVWENIFAKAIGADWKPSNVGLDDIRLGVCAWGAKSVKNSDPFTCTKVRLISGRNNPEYSFGKIERSDEGIGRQILEIWNARVESLRDTFSHLRTVVLIKSNDFTKFTIFETETVIYPIEHYNWKRNQQGNLEGFAKATNEHCFTWQRHGSQFTIIEPVPVRKIKFQIKLPIRLEKDFVLDAIGFEKNWIKVVK